MMAKQEECTANREMDRVIISVDDTDVVQGRAESPRAQSLSRLNVISDMEDGQHMSKWPSFPRLGRQIAGMADNNSTTNLYTDSVSPRVSMENLTLGESPKERNRLSLGDYGGLIRSASAKAVDSIPPQDSPSGSPKQKVSSYYLSPVTGGDGANLVSRSTSCPSMACVPNSRSPAHSHCSHSPGTPQRRILPSTPAEGEVDKDVDLEGEEIADLPIEPGQNFPDFFPEEEKPNPGRDSVDERPLHTRRLREKALKEKYVPKYNGECRLKSPPQKKNDLPFGYLNIGDIPPSLARKVISEKDVYRPEVSHDVQEKCLQWLNSLDNEH